MSSSTNGVSSSAVHSLKNDGLPAKVQATGTDAVREYRNLTQDVVDEIKALRPELNRGMTVARLAAKVKIPLSRLRWVIACLDNKRDPLLKPANRTIAKKDVPLFKKLKDEVDSGNKNKEEAAAILGISRSSYYNAVMKLENGEDPSEIKSHQKVVKYTKEQIEALIPQLDEGDITTQEAAKRCNLSVEHFRIVLAEIREGKDPSKRKKAQKVDEKIVAKITAQLPNINTIDKQKFAKELNISYETLRTTIKKLERGEDPLQKKARHKITEEDEKNIKTYIPQIDARKITYEQIAKELEKEGKGPSITQIKYVVNKIRSGKSTAEYEYKKIDEAAREIIKDLFPKIKAGSVSMSKAAQKAGISESSVAKMVKRLDKGQELTSNIAYDKITPEMREWVRERFKNVKTGILSKAAIRKRWGITRRCVDKIISEIEESQAASKKAKSSSSSSSSSTKSKAAEPDSDDDIPLKDMSAKKKAAKASASDVGSDS